MPASRRRNAPGRLERAIERLGRRRRRSTAAGLPNAGSAFRAAVDERLRSLERQLDEVKGRINGLLFMLAGTVIVEVIRGLMP